MKKAVLFTVSLIMISSIVLALAILNFSSAEKGKERLAELGSLDRMYEVSNSISYGFKQIFNYYSGINVTLNNLEVTFEENLPNNNDDNFDNIVQDYKNYIESDDSNIKLNINELIEDLVLTINSYNITYKHDPFGSSKILVNRDQVNYNKIYVEIQPGFSINSCTWSTSPGSLVFQLKTNDAQCDDTVNLDESQNNVININNNGLIITINNGLLIENNLAASKIITKITLNDIDEKITVSANDVIDISYNDLNISKNSGFRII